MIISIGKLRHRLGIYLRAQSPNVEGSITYTDLLLAEVWGYIEPKKGSQYLYSQQIDSAITHNILIRYLSYLTSEHWIKYTQQVFRTNNSTTNDSLQDIKLFRIKNVKNIFQLQRFQMLECEEYNET